MMTEEATRQTTSASAWKKKAREGTDLELPSGNVARVRNPGIQHFLKTGVIPDSLTGMVRNAIATDGGKKELDVSEMIKDEESLREVLSLFDHVLLAVVIEPKVAMPPTNDDGTVIPIHEREITDDTPVYVDEVDDDDKTFIFQFAVGGTRDLESFRQQQAEMLATVQSGSNLEGAS